MSLWCHLVDNSLLAEVVVLNKYLLQLVALYFKVLFPMYILNT